MEDAWRKLRLSVQISTKLNRPHLIHGEIAYILPCLGRTEIDRQASGPQAVSVEDSTTCVHGSRGVRTPVCDTILSEPKIVAEIAKQTLPPNPKIDWDDWVTDYGKVRDAIEATYPEQFKEFNKRMFTPGGFARPNPARERKWNTKNGKANFHVPPSLDEDSDMASGDEVFMLITLRSNDQFNTSIYGYDDRFRGIKGTRRVLMMNPSDISRLSLQDGDDVDVTTVASDSIDRCLRAPSTHYLRSAERLLLGLLSRVQCTRSALAPCRAQQSSCLEIRSGHRREERNALVDTVIGADLSTSKEPVATLQAIGFSPSVGRGRYLTP